MSGASARLSAALDCVLSDHTVQCKRDGHAGWNGPEHVKLGSDSHGNFMVQLPCVVAIARQIDLKSANEWLRRLTQAEKSNVVVSERTWASSNNMTVRSCPVSEVQNVMEHAASEGVPEHCRGGKGQPLNKEQIAAVCRRIQTKAQELCCSKMMQLRATMAASIGGDATTVDSGEGTRAHPKHAHWEKPFGSWTSKNIKETGADRLHRLLAEVRTAIFRVSRRPDRPNADTGPAEKMTDCRTTIRSLFEAHGKALLRPAEEPPEPQDAPAAGAEKQQHDLPTRVQDTVLGKRPAGAIHADVPGACEMQEVRGCT